MVAGDPPGAAHTVVIVPESGKGGEPEAADLFRLHLATRVAVLLPRRRLWIASSSGEE
jgi:hypothetical protein